MLRCFRRGLWIFVLSVFSSVAASHHQAFTPSVKQGQHCPTETKLPSVIIRVPSGYPHDISWKRWLSSLFLRSREGLSLMEPSHPNTWCSARYQKEDLNDGTRQSFTIRSHLVWWSALRLCTIRGQPWASSSCCDLASPTSCSPSWSWAAILLPCLQVFLQEGRGDQGRLLGITRSVVTPFPWAIAI